LKINDSGCDIVRNSVVPKHADQCYAGLTSGNEIKEDFSHVAAEIWSNQTDISPDLKDKQGKKHPAWFYKTFNNVCLNEM